jgi:hypothetical protein
MVEFEKRGLPTVSWTAAGFVEDALRSAENFGMPTLSIATMPLPFTNQSPDNIGEMVRECIDQVVHGLTKAPEKTREVDAGFTIVSDERLTFEGEDLLHAMEVMNRQFLEWKWSDGFPLIPPTPERVEGMLRGTSRAEEPAERLRTSLPALSQVLVWQRWRRSPPTPLWPDVVPNTFQS